MKKSIYILSLLSFIALIFFSSCERDRYEKKITYFVTRSTDGFEATYLLGQDNFIKESIVVNSQEEVWKIDHYANPGDIVYISVMDTVPNSFVNVRIMIDGKFFKEKSRDDITTKPVTVSGTVPY